MEHLLKLREYYHDRAAAAHRNGLHDLALELRCKAYDIWIEIQVSKG